MSVNNSTNPKIKSPCSKRSAAHELISIDLLDIRPYAKMSPFLSAGYHKKHHKDDYKKNKKFWDKAHKTGKHKKYGQEDSHHSSKEGKHKKGKHHHSGYKEAHKGKKGASKKGHHDKAEKKWAGKKGNDKHHEHKESYGKKGGKKSGKKWGYKEKH